MTPPLYAFPRSLLSFAHGNPCPSFSLLALRPEGTRQPICTVPGFLFQPFAFFSEIAPLLAVCLGQAPIFFPDWLSLLFSIETCCAPIDFRFFILKDLFEGTKAP